MNPPASDSASAVRLHAALPAAALTLVAGLAGCASWGPDAAAKNSDVHTAPAAPAPATPMALSTPRLDPYAVDAAAEGGASHADGAHRPDTAAAEPVAAVSAYAWESSKGTLSEGMEGLAQISFASEGADFDPQISRDAKRVVFASTQHRGTADLYIKNVGSRTVTQLTADAGNDIMPALSPDGQRVAFVSDRSGHWQLYVMSIHGGQAVQLTGERTHDLHPSWSPDGRKLVYCRLGQVSKRWELWVMDVTQTAAAEFVGYGMFPEWCPVPGTANGADKILFQRGRERGDRAFSLWTIDYKPGDASAPTEIVSGRDAAAINPTWSPDGMFVAYASVASSGEPRPGKPVAADLWIAAVDGSTRINMTVGTFTNLMPTWASDGKLYFVSDRGGVDNIWSVGTDKALAGAGLHVAGPASAGATGHATPGHAADAHPAPQAPVANVPEGH